jgi:hypothetical protein
MDIDHPAQPKGKRSGLASGGARPRDAYWVSLSAREDAEPFGVARGGETILNARGKALAAAWRELGELREGVEPDAVRIGTGGLEGILLLPGKASGTSDLGALLRFFKVMSSLRLAQLGKTARQRNAAVTGAKASAKAPSPLWKRGYAEKSLADAAALAKARKTLKGMEAR